MDTILSTFTEEGQSHGRAELAVRLLGLAIVAFTIIWTFFTTHPETLDDIGLYNATYTFVEYGTMTYPANAQFHTMTIHPPVHYWVLGLLMKAGMSRFYAEAIPPFFFILLTVYMICRSRISASVKVGLLVGLTVFFTYYHFFPRIRPETHWAAAWYAGLVSLEAARLDDWKPSRLFLGALLVTYASTLHYVAYAACLGVLAYLIWVLVEKRGNGVIPGAALVAGGCLVGIPYLVIFVIPEWADIMLVIKQVNPFGGVAANVVLHQETSRTLYLFFADSFSTKLLFYPLSLGVPAVLVSTVALMAIRDTRVLALASLPYPLFFWLFVQRKQYILPEVLLYVLGVTVLLIVGLSYLISRRWPHWKWIVAPACGTFLFVSLLSTSPMFNLSKLTLRPTIPEADVARAAGRSILGPNALVGARLARFYQYGAAHSYMIEPDLLWRNLGDMDLQAYFRLFDAIGEDDFWSYGTRNEKNESLSSWYANGTLSLRGFFFATPLNYTISYLLLVPSRTEPLQGYGMLDPWRVARFEEQPSGTHIFVSAICDRGIVTPEQRRKAVVGEMRGAIDHLSQFGISTLFNNAYVLPAPIGDTPSKEVVTFVAERKRYSFQRPALLARCTIRDEFPISMETFDARTLAATLKTDRPIRFYENLSDAIEGRYGPELQVELATTGWPQGFRLLHAKAMASPLSPWPPGLYALTGGEAQDVFRSDMESGVGWGVNRYGHWGGLEFERDGLAPRDASGKYSVGDARDHLVTPYVALPQSNHAGAFFSLWVKPLGHGEPPDFYLQDEQYFAVAAARLRAERPDGWILLAGLGSVAADQKVRLVIQGKPGSVLLLDKVLLTVVHPSHSQQTARR